MGTASIWCGHCRWWKRMCFWALPWSSWTRAKPIKGNLFYRQKDRRAERNAKRQFREPLCEGMFSLPGSPERWLTQRQPPAQSPAHSPSDLSSLGGCVEGLCSLRNVSVCGRTQALLSPRWKMCSAYFKNVPCISCLWAAQCASALPLDIAWRKTLHPRRNFHPWPNAVWEWGYFLTSYWFPKS